MHTDPGMAYWMREEVTEEEFGENEELEACFWKDWTPEVDWRNGEYYPQIRDHETEKWLAEKGLTKYWMSYLTERMVLNIIWLFFISITNKPCIYQYL